MKLMFRIAINILRRLFFQMKYGPKWISPWINNYALDFEINILQNGKIKLGNKVVIDKFNCMDAVGDGYIRVGNNVYFNRYCILSCHKGIDIGDGCVFGPSVRIYDNNHLFSRTQGVTYQHSFEKIEIGKNCWIGANVIILKGTKIGDNCVIGAGCVVSGEIPEGSLVTQDRSLKITPIKG